MKDSKGNGGKGAGRQIVMATFGYKVVDVRELAVKEGAHVQRADLDESTRKVLEGGLPEPEAVEELGRRIGEPIGRSLAAEDFRPENLDQLAGLLTGKFNELLFDPDAEVVEAALNKAGAEGFALARTCGPSGALLILMRQEGLLTVMVEDPVLVAPPGYKVV